MRYLWRPQSVAEATKKFLGLILAEPQVVLFGQHIQYS